MLILYARLKIFLEKFKQIVCCYNKQLLIVQGRETFLRKTLIFLVLPASPWRVGGVEGNSLYILVMIIIVRSCTCVMVTPPHLFT